MPERRIPFTIGTAIDHLLLYIEKAKNNENIKKPISWALYQTWKWIDAHEIERSLGEACSPNIGTYSDGIWYICGRCGGKLYSPYANGTVVFNVDELPRYCPHCKGKVKWFERQAAPNE